ncbi:B-cell receptor CD22-like isoform X2 [Xiphias gladius]|uniref:B-cell receptor CD22-like isoform X2 n=1 Tax=Xiphias gladius TaxID=8245 RepID=UPI001A98112C|nr:B-cell receptor CD22-like isoform X2 [Xiphias gladius]
MKKMITMLVLLIMKEGTESSGWSVTFENLNPCALKGSSVEFRCSYNYRDGETVKNTSWYKGDLKDGIWKRVDLSDLPSYENRSEYVGDQQHDCSLVIHDLLYSDSGYYYFRFDTKTYGWRSRKSVYLSVTELNASVSPKRVRAGDNVTLECRTSCHLSSTVWFRDGHPVAKPEFRARVEDSGHYLCALQGQESEQSDPVALDVQYPPLNVSIEVSHPGPLAEGSSVNLTCSSVANPAADSYTWYMSNVSSSGSSSMLQVGSGQVLSLPSVEASHAGLYLCQARNSVGENNSTEWLMTLYQTDRGRDLTLLWMKRSTAMIMKTSAGAKSVKKQNRVTQKEMSV